MELASLIVFNFLLMNGNNSIHNIVSENQTI